MTDTIDRAASSQSGTSARRPDGLAALNVVPKPGPGQQPGDHRDDENAQGRPDLGDRRQAALRFLGRHALIEELGRFGGFGRFQRCGRFGRFGRAERVRRRRQAPAAGAHQVAAARQCAGGRAQPAESGTPTGQQAGSSAGQQDDGQPRQQRQPQSRQDQGQARQGQDQGRQDRQQGQGQDRQQGQDRSQSQGQNQDRQQGGYPRTRTASRVVTPRTRAATTPTTGGGRRRNRQRSRDRKRGRTGAPMQGGQDYTEPEVQLSAEDVLVPVAGILDILDNYGFVRTSGYPRTQRRLRPARHGQAPRAAQG